MIKFDFRQNVLILLFLLGTITKVFASDYKILINKEIIIEEIVLKDDVFYTSIESVADKLGWFKENHNTYSYFNNKIEYKSVIDFSNQLNYKSALDISSDGYLTSSIFRSQFTHKPIQIGESKLFAIDDIANFFDAKTELSDDTKTLNLITKYNVQETIIKEYSESITNQINKLRVENGLERIVTSSNLNNLAQQFTDSKNIYSHKEFDEVHNIEKIYLDFKLDENFNEKNISEKVFKILNLSNKNKEILLSKDMKYVGAAFSIFNEKIYVCLYVSY